MPSPPPSTADLTTVPARTEQTVTDLLGGQCGTVLQALARDAVCRAWMGGYLGDPAEILLDVTRHASATAANFADLQKRVGA